MACKVEIKDIEERITEDLLKQLGDRATSIDNGSAISTVDGFDENIIEETNQTYASNLYGEVVSKEDNTIKIHPTQSLADAMTAQNERDELNGNTNETRRYSSENKGEYEVRVEEPSTTNDSTNTDNIQQQGGGTEGKFNSVKAVWSQNRNLQFTGTTRVKNASDVAEIMSLLENKSVEHGFAVHIDQEGNSHIQFLSIGGTTATVIDTNLVSAGVAKFNSKRVYLVHNHPSGNMNPSTADLQVTKQLRDGLMPIGVDVSHVIMDTYKKEYVIIDTENNTSVFTRGVKYNQEELQTNSITEQEILSPPLKKITSANEVFKTILNFRFSAMPKVAMLVLDQSSSIIANYVLQDGIDYKEIMANVGETGIGRSVIFYGNQNTLDQVNSISPSLAKLNIRVLDVIVVNSDNDVVAGYYESMGDKGMLNEHQEIYQTNSVPQFQKGETTQTIPLDQEVIDKLEESGLANNIYQLSSTELEAKLKEIGVANVQQTTNGFVYKGDVYLNRETATNDTAIHEYSHLFSSWLQKNKPETYKKGLDLISEELEKDNSEIQSIIDYVEQAQPNLEGDAKKEEILSQLIGERGAELIENSKTKGGIIDWLKDVWKQIGQLLGITKMTPQQISQITLQEYTDAIIADLMSGDKFDNEKYDGESNFEKWKGNNKLLEGEEVQDAKTGEPIVIRGYHGTTNEFYEFDASIKGNIEGHLGKVNYFTTEESDANGNYQSDGKDLTNRVDSRQEQLEDSLRYDYANEDEDNEGLILADIARDFNLTQEELEELYPSGIPELVQAEEVSRFLAEKELIGGDEKVLDVYIKLNNPIVLGNGSTWFDTINISEEDMEDAAQQIADENDITIEEAKDDYDSDIRDRAMENSGEGNIIVEALETALSNNGYDLSAMDVLGDNYYETEVDLNTIEKTLRGAEMYENYDGELASSQVIAEFFENLGFDGIILTDVSSRFSNMGLVESTSHIHVFDQYNNQIKLADGSNITFNPNTSDIRYQKAPNLLQEAVDMANSINIKLLEDGEVTEVAEQFQDVIQQDLTQEQKEAVSIQGFREFIDNPNPKISNTNSIYASIATALKNLYNSIEGNVPSLATKAGFRISKARLSWAEESYNTRVDDAMRDINALDNNSRLKIISKMKPTNPDQLISGTPIINNDGSIGIIGMETLPLQNSYYSFRDVANNYEIETQKITPKDKKAIQPSCK